MHVPTAGGQANEGNRYGHRGPRKNDNVYLATVLVLTMALFWPIGIEQLVPAIVFAAFLFYVSFIKRNSVNVYYGVNSILLLLFILIYILSGFNIQSKLRFITFYRDFLLYLPAVFVFMIFSCRNSSIILESYTKLFSGIYFAFLGCAILYLIWPVSFPSLAYSALPDFIAQSMMGQRGLVKGFGEQLYFYGFTARVSAFFSSPIHLSCIIILLTPFAMNLNNGNLWRVFIVSVSAIMLVLSQARLAMAVFLVMPFFVYVVHTFFVPGSSKSGIVLIFLTFAALICLYVVNFDDINSFFEVLFFERRRGSAESRFTIYTVTWDMILQRPLLGYGTQQDIPGIEYPAGSHSAYLGLLFKQGVLGLLTILWVLASSVLRLFRYMRSQRGKEQALALWFFSAICCYLALLIFNEYIPDVYHTYLLFMLLGIVNGLRIPVEQNVEERNSFIPQRWLQGV